MEGILMLSTRQLTENERRAVRHELRVRWRATVIEIAGESKNVSRQCKRLGMPRSTYYRWKKRFDEEGIAGLSNRCSGPNRHPRSTPPHVVKRFPFRIHTIRTDRGHEFQAQFHWHVEDQGMRHVYIKPRTPQLNGKVERSHRTDQEEFYQLLTYTDDVNLNKKLAEWESFYNFSRPHGAFDGKSPYEALRDQIQ
jgi:transposase